MLGPDDLEAWAARLGLTESIKYVRATASTNADLATRAREGAPHGSALVAGFQSQGRGRLDRTWEAPEGTGIALSVLLRPDLPIERFPLASLAAGVAVAEVAGESYRLKWPNDLLAPDGRKVAGLLVEADLEEGWVVVGIGLNVHGAPDLPEAAAIEAVDGIPRDRARLCAELVWALLREVERLRDDPGAVLDRWRGRSHTLGRRVRVGAVEGLAVDVDGSGALVIETSEGRRAVHAGDVSTGPRALAPRG